MRKYLFGFLAVSFFLFLPGQIKAITLSPATQELVVPAGKSTEFTVKIYNETTKPAYLQAALKKFVPAGLSGGTQILNSSSSDRWLKWFVLPGKYLKVQPQEMKEVKISLQIPATEYSGEYFPVLIWRSFDPANSQKDLGVFTEVGTLIFLQVSGSKIEKLNLEDFKLDSFNFFSWPKSFSYLVNNNGNIHLNPSGILTIKGPFYQKEIVLNAGQGRVLPQSQRQYIEAVPSLNFWRSLTSFGRYEAKLKIYYGDPAQVLTAEKTFFALSGKLPVFLLVILLVLAYLIKKYKK